MIWELVYGSDVVFWRFDDSTVDKIPNIMEAVYLGGVYVQEDRIAVV